MTFSFPKTTALLKNRQFRNALCGAAWAIAAGSAIQGIEGLSHARAPRSVSLSPIPSRVFAEPFPDEADRLVWQFRVARPASPGAQVRVTLNATKTVPGCKSRQFVGQSLGTFAPDEKIKIVTVRVSPDVATQSDALFRGDVNSQLYLSDMLTVSASASMVTDCPVTLPNPFAAPKPGSVTGRGHSLPALLINHNDAETSYNDREMFARQLKHTATLVSANDAQRGTSASLSVDIEVLAPTDTP